MTRVFTGDVGTQIVLDCGIDVTAATLMQIKARPPRSGLKVFTATLEAPNSITHTVLSGDFDQPGIWKLQAYVEMPGWSGYGDVVELSITAPV